MHPKKFSHPDHQFCRMGEPDMHPDWCDRLGQAIRKARPGKFRVVWEDHEWFHDSGPVGEYSTLEEAIECASTHDQEEGVVFWFFIYNDRGELVWNKEGKLPDWPE